MSVSRRVALLAGLATLALAPLGGTVERSTAGSSAPAKAKPAGKTNGKKSKRK